MSFWTTSTGENLASKSETERQSYTPPSNDFEPIPEGSVVRAYVKEAKWQKQYQSDEMFVQIRWKVVKPDAVGGREFNQKFWVKDADPSAKDPNGKRDKAKAMLMKVDALAGGKLAAGGSEPTDDHLLMALANKEMAVLVGEYNIENADGSRNTGNFARDNFPCEGTELIVKDAKPAKSTTSSGAVDDLDGDSIPF